MGGIGSGGYEHQRTKGMVTNDRVLDIRFWQREGVMKPGLRFHLTWGQPENHLIPGVAVRVEEQRVILIYRYQQADGSMTVVKYSIALDWTLCPFGGRRSWFRCPKEGCDRRVAILYPSGCHFTCRHCQRLAYPSQRENATDRNLRRARKIARKLGSREGSINSFSDKPKRMRWRTYQGLVNDANAATLRAMRAVLNQAHY